MRADNAARAGREERAGGVMGVKGIWTEKKRSRKEIPAGNLKEQGIGSSFRPQHYIVVGGVWCSGSCSWCKERSTYPFSEEVELAKEDKKCLFTGPETDRG